MLDQGPKAFRKFPDTGPHPLDPQPGKERLYRPYYELRTKRVHLLNAFIDGVNERRVVERRRNVVTYGGVFVPVCFNISLALGRPSVEECSLRSHTGRLFCRFDSSRLLGRGALVLGRVIDVQTVFVRHRLFIRLRLRIRLVLVFVW